MIIKKGTKVRVSHQRHGVFEGVATRDFDTDKDEFYPIATYQIVFGVITTWYPGEIVPCHNTHCTIIPHG